MKIKVILITDGEWCRADSYEEALERLDRQINADYYREKEEGKQSDLFVYEKEEVVPKAMILTDDETAEIDRYGQLLTEGGCWHVTIPLAGKRPPSPDYRFCIMQDLKDEDFQRELWEYRRTRYKDEFDAFCKKEGGVYDYCTHNECEFYGKSKCECLKAWWEKYKKPEEKKEGSND